MATFQEFWCISGGNNMNGGSEGTSTTAIAAACYVTSTNGAWDAVADDTTVSTFTCADTPTLVSGMIGMYASVFKDGDTVPTANRYVNALITAIDNTAKTITLSIAARSTLGTAIGDQANGYTIKIGGAWSGPAADVGFPFGFIAATSTNADATATPRVNFIGEFNISTGISHSLAGPIYFQGCTTTAGDSGMAIINGGTNAIVLATIASTRGELIDFEFISSATSGTNGGVFMNPGIVRRVVVHGTRGYGIRLSQGGCEADECEVYDFGKGGANIGIYLASNSFWLRDCIVHDGVGVGYYASYASVYFTSCIAHNNTTDGFKAEGTIGGTVVCENCDAYDNGGDGLKIANTTKAITVVAKNCNFVLNGGWGINGSSAAGRIGRVVNCGFGTGTKANASGTVTGLKSMIEIGTVNYPNNVTPWVDPDDGDFRISLAEAKNAGRGVFTQTASGYGDPNPTVASRDIGAGRHADPRASDYGLTVDILKDGETVDDVVGEYPTTEASQAAQKATDAAFLETNKDEIIPDDTDILAEFGVTGTASVGSGGGPLVGPSALISG